MAASNGVCTFAPQTLRCYCQSASQWISVASDRSGSCLLGSCSVCLYPFSVSPFGRYYIEHRRVMEASTLCRYCCRHCGLHGQLLTTATTTVAVNGSIDRHSLSTDRHWRPGRLQEEWGASVSEPCTPLQFIAAVGADHAQQESYFHWRLPPSSR